MTQEDDFFSFKGAGSATVSYQETGTPTIEMMAVTGSVPAIAGREIGEPVDNTPRQIKMAQIILPAPNETIFPNFNWGNPSADSQFGPYCTALDNLGDALPPLHVVPIGQEVCILGEYLPVFAVLDDPIQFLAMQYIRRSMATVVFETGHIGEIIIRALSRIQNGYRPNVLDLCDTARNLKEYGFSLETIAMQIGRDPETNTRIDASTVSRWIGVAGLGPEIRELILSKQILLSHAVMLVIARLEVRPDEQLALAKWVAQSPTKKVYQLEEAIAACFPPKGASALAHIVVHANGSIDIVDEPALRLANDTRKLRYPTMTPVSPDEVDRLRSVTFKSVHVAQNTDGEVLVTSSALSSLSRWAETTAKSKETSLHEVEVAMFAWLDALRADATEKDLLTRSGKVAPVVSKVTVES